jgi:hypothetical protein
MASAVSTRRQIQSPRLQARVVYFPILRTLARMPLTIIMPQAAGPGKQKVEKVGDKS